MLTSIIGCGGTASSSAVSAGQQIIAKARAAHLLDATFTITWVNQELSGTIDHFIGQGKVTLHPYRSDVHVRTAPTDYPADTLEDIADYATKVVYFRDSLLPGTAGTTWHKSEGPPAAFELANIPLIYQQLSSATLVGKEQVSGITTWHIRGTLTAPDIYNANETDSAVIDIYLRQDTYLPVKLVAHVTGSTPQDDTLIYTAFNTGVTINLPTVGQ